MSLRRHEASLEVLADGSELTAPAIFLTIRRRTGRGSDGGGDGSVVAEPSPPIARSYVFHREAAESDAGAIVARYALTGLPTLTGRLAADQSFKLLHGGAFRAVLVPTLVSTFGDGCYGLRGASVGGLSALFLSLVQSGYKVAEPAVQGKAEGGRGDSSDSAPEDGDGPRVKSEMNSGAYGDVSIVGPPGSGDMIDGILDNMFGNVRRRPSIRVCEVPAASNWWKVYEDSYVKIWGRAVRHNSFHAALCGACLQGKDTQTASDELSPSSSSAEPVDSDDDSDSSDASSASKGSGASSNAGECSVVYIVMLLSEEEKDGRQHPHAFAIMPPTLSSSTPSRRCAKCDAIVGNGRQKCNLAPYWDAFRNLPREIVSTGRGCQPLLEFLLHLDPAIEHKEDCNVEARCDAPHRKRQRTEQSRKDADLSGPKVSRYQICIPSFASKLVGHHLATFPDGRAGDSLDGGLLIRARHRSQLLHNNLPFAFPLNESYEHDNHQMSGQLPEEDEKNRGSLSSVAAHQLRSCTFVLLKGHGVRDTGDGRDKAEQPFVFVTRSESIRDRCKDGRTSIAGNDDSPVGDVVDITHTAKLLKCAFEGGQCICGECNTARASDADDGNEIELDDSSSDGDSKQPAVGVIEDEASCRGPLDTGSPHLLMLGTGCATPSPLRGSSAMALLLPTLLDGSAALVLSAIIECGEGTLTGLLRHLPTLKDEQEDDVGSRVSLLDAQLRHVHFIWISHSHLDHYGELPFLVQAIANAKQKSKQLSTPLLVIAPSKVLRYLGIFLPHKSNASRCDSQRLYVGCTHRDFQHSPFAVNLRKSLYEYALPRPHNKPGGYNLYNPFAVLQNVEVEHCREAFALILQLNVPPNSNGQNAPSRFTLCFSGDTRPSAQLVRACRSLQPSQSISLLIHEATFMGDSHGKVEATKKRHSTSTEALGVAKSMNAEACLLTHFSQRYQRISVDDVCPGQQLYPFSWGIAVDGMMIPLTKRALPHLFHLSQCVDSLHRGTDNLVVPNVT